MKLNLTLAAAAVAAAVAAPAFAADSTSFAIEHLNRSADTPSERIAFGPNGPVLGTTVSSMSGDSVGIAIANHNASVDRASDRISLDSVTNFAGAPAYAADIFEQLRLADDDN